MWWLPLAGAFAVWSGAVQDGPQCAVDSAKIGIGAAATRRNQQVADDTGRIGVAWAYDWQAVVPAAQGGVEWVPMIRARRDMARLDRVPRDAGVLLTFNEPDEPRQAAMSVKAALAAWPRLMQTGLRLASPAPSQKQALGPKSWLGRFMAGAEARGYRVDFVAVHYYSTNGDVAAFRAFLEQVHADYGRPVWVTEWALADWAAPDRFSPAQQAEFARAAILMMDALPWVERHAWFSLYDGADGWHLRSHLIDRDTRPTPLGRLFTEAAKGHVKCFPAVPAPVEHPVAARPAN